MPCSGGRGGRKEGREGGQGWPRVASFLMGFGLGPEMDCGLLSVYYDLITELKCVVDRNTLVDRQAGLEIAKTQKLLLFSESSVRRRQVSFTRGISRNRGWAFETNEVLLGKF